MKKTAIFIFLLTGLIYSQVNIVQRSGSKEQNRLDTRADSLIGVVQTANAAISLLQNQTNTQTTDINALYDSIQALRDYINSFTPIVLSLAAPTLTSATADDDSALIVLIFSSDASADSTVIQRSTDQASWTNIDTVNEDVTSLWETTTSENTTYYYRLYSYNTTNQSAYSSVKSATTIVTSETYVIYMPASKTTTLPDSLGTLAELQDMINDDLIPAGTTIKFERGGTWTTRGNIGTNPAGLDLTGLEGTADAYITFTSYGTGNKPRFDFTGYGDVFNITSTAYLKFDSLDIHPSGTWGTPTDWNLPRYAFFNDNVNGFSYIEITNCKIQNTVGGIAGQSFNTDIHHITIKKDSIIGTIGGLTEIGSPGTGVAVSFQGGGTGYDHAITIDSNYFYNIGGDNSGVHEHAIYTHDNSRGYIITNNIINGTDDDDGFAIAGSDSMVISGNSFTGVINGISITPQQKVSGRIDSVWIYNNTFTDIGTASVKFSHSSDSYTDCVIDFVRIYNNKFYDSDVPALSFNCTSTNFDSVKNVLIANNTIVNCGTVNYGAFYNITFHDGIIQSGNSMVNNIFVNTSSALPLIKTKQGLANIFDEVDYNLYYRTTGTNVWEVNSVSKTFAEVQSTYSFETNGVNDNPDFTNIDTYDLTLTDVSPAIDAGTDLTDFTTDFEGDTRSTYDIGYDEYIAP